MRYFLLGLAGLALLLGGAGCAALKSSMRDPYQASIERTFQDTTEQRLITLAEQAPVPEETLRLMAGGPLTPAHSVEDWRRQWWSRDFDGIRIVQYITPAALDYYQEVLGKFRRGDFGVTGGIKMLTASLTYKAGVTRHAQLELRGRSFPAGYRVTLTLEWSQYCGRFCSMGTGATREVVFDQDGQILAIFGDNDERLTLVSDIAPVIPAPAS